MSASDRPGPSACRRHALGALTLGTMVAAAGTLAARSSAVAAAPSAVVAGDVPSDKAPPAAPTAAPPVGPEWPRIALLDGTTLEPGAWRGQAIVLVVWATYCAYCRRHNPRIEALHRATADRPLRVLGAALDRDPELVRRHAREQGYTFPITLDAALLRERFGLRRVIPTTVTFDRQGRLLQRIPGEMAEDDIRALARLADAPT